MVSAIRRATEYLLGAFGVMLLLAFVYQWGFATFEGEQVDYIHSLYVVVETFTTTGFGLDADRWSSDEMLVLMAAMQLAGVGLIFLALPAVVVPLVNEALTSSPPRTTTLTDHVVICEFTPRGETLVRELRSRDQPYVVVVPDADRAVDLAADHEVVHGDPEAVETLERANVGSARALVADADDETNASVVLSARECSEALRVVSLVEDEDVADYHRYAGADRVLSPRRLLGESLGAKATTSVADELGDGVEIGEDFQVAELLVHSGSPLVGDTVGESAIRERTGANVLGAWDAGEFESPPRPDRLIDEHTVLLVVGGESELESLKELTLSETRRRRRGRVIVAGYGMVGHSAAEELRPRDEVVVVDEADAPGVDIVGDATHRETLEAAGVDDARAVVIALDSDTTTIFATLAVRQVAPHAEVIARANDADSVRKLYRAGADYVLSLSTVSGRLLASHLLDEEVLRPETQVDLVRTAAPRLEGRTLAGADVRAATGVTVVAVERDGDLLTDVGPDTKVIDGDRLVVAGTDDAVNRFNGRFA
ncbi:potassium channel family protein [Halobaculum gomorrense]|uniref:Trk K+ transport system, NAD-binding component n=1 Tax=Halobaculum gomorrense TaxID=43928 RepID=A0A1M5N0Q6_9EURY|nr:NAD-binding protein [Halobaculum gomorrense]SHG83035.1 Trk K+ transport system, NAD-binding component [Halobaculum gomorrense]